MGRFEAKPDIVTKGLITHLDPGTPFSIPRSLPLNVNYLIVAGGGGGGSDDAGGGGAGGLLTGTTTLSGESYPITVGAGGSPGTQAGTGASNGSQGGNSIAFGLTAIGGGYGATQGVNGGSGGSGGGGGHSNSGAPTSGGNGTSQQGGKGGGGRFYTYPWPGGGGGGASQNGVDGLDGITGDGGDGINFSTWLSGLSLGDNGWFAGGGGGGYKPANVIPLGGNGGGGNGGNDESNAGSQRPTPGAQNTGGGGGGSGQARGDSTYQGKSGGSGIVIARYPGLPAASGGTIYYQNGITYHVFTSSGTFTPNKLNDITGNGNHGTLINSPAHNPHQWGGTIYVDGTDDHIDVAGTYPTGNDARTVAGWFKSGRSTYAGNADHIINYGNALTAQAFGFMLHTGNQFRFYGHGGAYDFSTNVLADTNWNYHCITYDGSLVVYYINGAKVASVSRNLNTGGRDMTLGDRPDHAFGNESQGNLGAVQVYNRTLSSIEVTQNFIAQKDRFGIGLPLDGLIVNLDASNASSYPRTGTTIYDLSGTGNDATLYNGAYWSGNYGGAWYFDGLNDYAAIPDNSTLDLAGDKSLGMWIYLHSDPGSGGFAGKANSTVKGMALGYGWSGNGFLALAWNSSNSPGIPPDDADVGNWYYLSAVQNGGTRYIHIIGENGYRTASSTSGTHSWDNSLDFVFGQAAGYYEKISVGAIHIHERALSAGEILGIYSTQKSRFGLS